MAPALEEGKVREKGRCLACAKSCDFVTVAEDSQTPKEPYPNRMAPLNRTNLHCGRVYPYFKAQKRERFKVTYVSVHYVL